MFLSHSISTVWASINWITLSTIRTYKIVYALQSTVLYLSYMSVLSEGGGLALDLVVGAQRHYTYIETNHCILFGGKDDHFIWCKEL